MSYVATMPMHSWPRAGAVRHIRRGSRAAGFGDAVSTASAVQQAGSLATPAVTGIIASHAASVAAATGAAHATVLGISATAAIPIIGAALAGATILAAYLIKNSGCGQTCIVTSQWANQAEAALKQNLAAYLALPSPRPSSARDVALANFDAVWKTLEQQCGQPGTGDAGKRCISDRQAGACKWKDSQGKCFNWFSGYRDPIANDTDVVASSDLSSLVSSVGSVLDGGALLPVLLIAGLLVAAVAL